MTFLLCVFMRSNVLKNQNFVLGFDLTCMNPAAPLKGIPSRVPTGGFRSSPLINPLSRPSLSRTPAGRKDGGIKLLDINEQPLGYAQAKKRKRMQGE